jgi:hypothetical protein
VLYILLLYPGKYWNIISVWPSLHPSESLSVHYSSNVFPDDDDDDNDNLLLLKMHIPADNFQNAAVVMKQWRGTCASFSVSASTFAYKNLSVV